MNQEKIGKFISKLRKEKNMTQQELANKIGITDRTNTKITLIKTLNQIDKIYNIQSRKWINKIIIINDNKLLMIIKRD